MHEVTGNLWEYPADWRCITTNPIINRHGQLVMGRGCAREAAERFPGLPEYAAQRVALNGNVVQSIVAHNLILFPVKHHWQQPADLQLIRQSAERLGQLCVDHDLGTVVLPRPGCGNGRLTWDRVKAMIEPLLPDNVHVITFK